MRDSASRALPPVRIFAFFPRSLFYINSHHHHNPHHRIKMSRPIAFLVDPVDEGSKASTSGDGTDRHAIAKARDGHRSVVCLPSQRSPPQSALTHSCRNSQLSFGSSDSQDYPLSSISSEDTSEEGGSSSQERSSSPVAAIKVVEEDIIQHRHICQGSDPLPYFDGRHGTSNADFLIDLETDSMERWVRRAIHESSADSNEQHARRPTILLQSGRRHR